MSSIAQHTPDETFVTAVANLVHPDSKVYDIYRQKVIVVGEKVHKFDNPMQEYPDPINVTTLSSVVDYIKADLADEPVIVVVKSPSIVEVIAPIVGDQRQKFTYLNAIPSLPSIQFGNYLPIENFIIQLQSCFEPTDSRDNLQAFISKLRTGLSKEIEDDGTTQRVTAHAGVTRSETMEVKPTWALAPWRSFPEIQQPLTSYLLRLKQQRDGDSLSAHAALFEADGGAWKRQAINAIGDWLRDSLGETEVTILS